MRKKHNKKFELLGRSSEKISWYLYIESDGTDPTYSYSKLKLEDRESGINYETTGVSVADLVTKYTFDNVLPQGTFDATLKFFDSSDKVVLSYPESDRDEFIATIAEAR